MKTMGIKKSLVSLGLATVIVLTSTSTIAVSSEPMSASHEQVAVQSTSSGREVDLTINGIPLETDVPAQIVNGRTLVPMRAILEKFEFNVSWDENTRTVSASKPGTSLRLTIGSRNASLNGRNIELDQAAIIIKDRTMVPIRFIVEALGADIEWDGTRSLTFVTGVDIDDGSTNLYYQSGKLMYSGEVKNNRPHGRGTMYYESGSIRYIGGFYNGTPNGYVISYYENGNLQYRKYTYSDNLYRVYQGDNLLGVYSGRDVAIREAGKWSNSQVKQNNKVVWDFAANDSRYRVVQGNTTIGVYASRDVAIREALKWNNSEVFQNNKIIWSFVLNMNYYDEANDQMWINYYNYNKYWSRRSEPPFMNFDMIIDNLSEHENFWKNNPDEAFFSLYDQLWWNSYEDFMATDFRDRN